MTTKKLTPDSRTVNGYSCTDWQVVGINGTVTVPEGYPNFSMDVYSLSATGTFNVKANVNGGSRHLEADLLDTAYPRTNYQGGHVLTFVGLPPSGYSVTASGDSGITGSIGFLAWR